jgi:hypothetical protein
MSHPSTPRHHVFSDITKEPQTMTDDSRSLVHLRSRRIGRLALALACAMAACLSLASAPASAKLVHVFEGNFSGADTPGGSLGLPTGAAIDNSAGPSAGDLYVGGPSGFGGPSAIVKLDPSGAYAGVEITGAETPQGSIGMFNFETFAASSGIAVDGSAGPHAGDIYVADLEHGVLDRFDEKGKFLCQITGKVPSTTAEEEAECAGAAGKAVPGGFSANEVAVNPVNGDVYVADASHAAIDEFNQAGEYTGRLESPEITRPGSIAFNSTGELYLVNGSRFEPGNVVKFDSASTFAAEIDNTSDTSVAVDPADDHVYVYRQYEEEVGEIAEYDPTGSHLLDAFGAEQNAYRPSLAISASTGKIYLTDFFALLGRPSDIYGPGLIIPDLSTAAATEVEETTATLNGEVDPAGGSEVQSCEFEYGETTEYGQTAPCTPATPYGSKTPVSAAISGLNPKTTYHFRLAAANENGVTDYTEDGEFHTKGAPTVEAESASNETRFTATLSGAINPHGHDTHYQIEYVDAEHFEKEGGFASPATEKTPLEDIGSSLEPQPVSQEVENLSVGTTYHYRIVASNSGGPVQGPGQTFETLPTAGFESRGAVARITSATVEAKVNPLSLDTTCQVQYVAEAEFNESGYANASAVPCDPADLGSGSSPQAAVAKLTNLGFDSTYHYRFVLTNESGTLHGPDEEFATFGIKSFSMEALNEAGEPETRAGGHPYELKTSVELNTSIAEGSRSADAIVKDILTKLPPGLIGNPDATPTCSLRKSEENQCSGDSQVGMIEVIFNPDQHMLVPLFNVVPPQGKAASFAAHVNLAVDAFIDAGIRTGGDYGITAGGHNITGFSNVHGVTVTIWGVPAGPSHTEERACPHPGHLGYPVGCASAAPEKPFLSMPTSCTGEPLSAEAVADAYAAPGEFARRSIELPALTGCNKLQFEPTLQARPSTSVADSPSGLHVDIHVPQNQEGPEGIEDPSGLRSADLRDAKITLPPGLVVNPSGANGLAGCSSAQFDIHGEGPANCPDAAKIGTVEVDSPLVNHPLPGSVYLATPHDNPFDSLLALYIAVNDPETGIVIKLAGDVQADPQTGQLTTTFNENPQLPFNDFKLDFFGGAKAPLRTPATCGEYQTTSELTPYSAPESGPPATPSDSYAIESGPGGRPCPASEAAEANKPAFEAGTEAPLAGAYSPFNLHLHREDGTQVFSALNVDLPPGLIGKLAGVGECSDAQLAAAAAKSGAAEQASPSCPANSRIGTVNVAAGAGPAPYYTQGTAYLSGPYKGAPLSVAIITPAVAGPFDLGTVVVRNALQVNPETAQISVKSDPIPTELQGIQLDIRSIEVKLDRPNFTLNPTNCEKMAIGGQEVSSLGNVAALTNPFQVGECGKLAFGPKLALKLKGATKRNDNPALRATLTAKPGQANIARAQVTLPHSEFLDQAHIGTVCTRVQFAANACPAASIYGHATAFTPLLDQPLSGPVYLRSSSNKLPDLVAALNGQIDVALDGKVDTGKGGGIRNTFEVVPDAPVSKFTLSLRGGSKGLLVNSENICKKPQHAIADFTGQNGKVSDTTPLIANGCKGVKAKKHKAKPHQRAAR